MARWILLSSLAMAGCSLTAPPLPAGPPVAVQEDEAMREAFGMYLGCAKAYAYEHRDSQATATEIAEAALIECRSYRRTYEDAVYKRNQIRPESIHLRGGDLRDLAESAGADAANEARGAALKVLVEVRQRN